MPKVVRNFIAGKMNKVFDERILPNGEYVDAMNIRMGSTENSEIGVIENSKGNTALTSLSYIDGTPLSVQARCIGAIADSRNEKIYWFVHDPAFITSTTGKLDMVVSYGIATGIRTYHIISTDDGGGANTTLNFNPKYLITGVNMIEDLIFFTDDYNAPRVFNINRKYSNPIAYIDQFNPESILVIKKPPVEAPIVEPIVTNAQNNYMDTRFICFAYRYRYEDGEYSATSQWSAPAFVPNVFEFSVDSLLNEGMTNFCNAANISYNAGGPLVFGIDLLFKQASSNVINIIDKLDKKILGISDYSINTYSFDNSKIYTILPESELLRLYDNVPRFAKAQTIMGNRLMYGNYVEGYDLIDKNNRDVSLEYETELISENIGESTLFDSSSDGNFTIDGPVTVTDSVVEVDLSGKDLSQGAALSIDVTITHGQFSGPSAPTETTDNIELNFSFFLPQDYASVYDMATSVQFKDAIGTALNIQTVNPNLSCGGTTFTDAFNCALPFNLDALIKVGSGISAIGQGIQIITTPGSSVIGLNFCAMKYVDSTTAPTTYAFEYYKIVFAEATFQEIATPRSLHSNRGYQVAMVYMDEFGRSSTALVSPYNRDTQHVPCGFADKKNSIQVTIPTTQIAPSWATRYKFVIKPDSENYETVYCSLFFLDPNTNEAYFLLEGENSRKVEQGDRLIVKADTDGPTQTCVYATVLEKESKAAGFITPVSGANVPAGVYMKISANDFAAVQDPDAIVAPGQKEAKLWAPVVISPDNVLLEYPMNIYRGPGFDPLNPTWEYENYTVPAGSRVKLYFKFERLGVRDGNGICEKRIYTLEKTLISSANYSNMKDWWDGDNVEAVLNDGIQDIGGNQCLADNQYISSLAPTPTDIPSDLCTNYYRFYRDGATNQLILLVRGTRYCGGSPLTKKKRESRIFVNIQVFRATNLLIFETEPEDALPDVFFENELSFEINADGEHFGNVQNQNFGTNTPAIIDTGFFNCYSFGNGVESYRIRDSIVGRTFNLGNRVTTVANQDYKEANRFADITYSGVYNPESNVNKLNEFNLGLLNYKNLETSFGDIYTIDGRETDVLVLQEDKISYVLAGKNLLSDAAAGGAITSVPEVLGTQIARTEKYGISFNPESYVQWGYDRFFTDAKRGAVIQMRGDSYSNEQLNVISEMGMRTWFRDVFNASFNTQKLGGFDPYMNEYVLVSNDIQLPINDQCIACGVSQTLTLTINQEVEKTFTYCVDVSAIVGDTVIDWSVVSLESGEEFTIEAVYNGTTYSSGPTDVSGSLNFFKGVNTLETVQISITYTGDLILDVLVNCPIPEVLNIVEVVVTNNSEAGKTIHAEYRYTAGTYVSPLQSNSVTFVSGTANPLVSRYNMVTGFAGSAGFPAGGNTMRLQTNKFGSDTYVFDPTKDKFKYERSSVLYLNNPVEIQNLLVASSTATPILGGGNTYYAEFTVPPSVDGDYLYLIWDLRDSIPVDLCYSETSIQDICCDCLPCEDNQCREILVQAIGGPAVVLFPEGICGVGFPYIMNLDLVDSMTVCIEDQTWQVISGNVSVSILSCGCPPCTESCNKWTFTSTDPLDKLTVEYYLCGETTLTVTTVDTTLTVCVDISQPDPQIVSGVGDTSVECECIKSTKFLFNENIPSLNNLSVWNSIVFSTGGFTSLTVSTVGPNTLYQLFGGFSETVQASSFWTVDPAITSKLLQVLDEAGSISGVANSGFFNCNNLTTVSLPNCIFIDDGAFFSFVSNSLVNISIPVCTSLGTTIFDNGVFTPNVGNTITLTVPVALMNAQGPGIPDGDIQYLQANNTVTVITV